MRSLLLVACLLLPAAAAAQAAEAPEAEAPEAESPPAPTSPAPVGARGAATPPGPGTSPTPPQDAAADPVALLSYGNRRLSVRSREHWVGGGYTTYSRTFYPFSPYVGFGSTYVVHEPVSTVREWSVYQGTQRLTVPAYLDVLGQRDEADRLRRRIRSRQVGSSVLIGTAVAGLVTSLVGGTTFYFARSREEAAAGAGLTIAGGITGVLSFGGSWGLAVDARRLRWDFPGMFDGGVQEQVRLHNDRLRQSLGLKTRDVRHFDPAPGLR